MPEPLRAGCLICCTLDHYCSSSLSPCSRRHDTGNAGASNLSSAPGRRLQRHLQRPRRCQQWRGRSSLSWACAPGALSRSPEIRSAGGPGDAIPGEAPEAQENAQKWARTKRSAQGPRLRHWRQRVPGRLGRLDMASPIKTKTKSKTLRRATAWKGRKALGRRGPDAQKGETLHLACRTSSY